MLTREASTKRLDLRVVRAICRPGIVSRTAKCNIASLLASMEKATGCDLAACSEVKVGFANEQPRWIRGVQLHLDERVIPHLTIEACLM